MHVAESGIVVQYIVFTLLLLKRQMDIGMIGHVNVLVNVRKTFLSGQ